MSIVVREAQPSDLPVAFPLWEALHREHEARDPRYRLADDAASRWTTDFRDWTRSRSSRVWLAVDRGEAVGLLTAHLYEPAPLYRQSLIVHVTDLYVSPDARGSGLGSDMLREARAWGEAEGALALQAGVLARNDRGRAFWTAQGADDYSITVSLPIRPGAPSSS